MTDDLDRLRRELRAMSAVNRQLRAELDGSAQRAISPPEGNQPTVRARAGSPDEAGAFKSSITGGGPSSSGVDQVEVVRGPTGVVYLVEGGNIRRIGSNVVAAALEEVFGPRRLITVEESARYATGPTIDVYCNESGRFFVSAAGRRMSIEGLPVVRDAPPGLEASLDAGPTLNLNHSVVSRSLYSSAMRGQRQLEWLQERAGNPQALARKVSGKIRRRKA